MKSRHGLRWTGIPFLCVALAGCGPAPVDRPRATPTDGTILWHALGSWSGRGDRQTESFDVTSGALRLAWEAVADGSSQPGRLRVSVHSAISGRPLHTLVDTTGVGSDTVRFAVDPRVAHLLVQSVGVEWTLTLEEGVHGPEG